MFVVIIINNIMVIISMILIKVSEIIIDQWLNLTVVQNTFTEPLHGPVGVLLSLPRFNIFTPTPLDFKLTNNDRSGDYIRNWYLLVVTVLDEGSRVRDIVDLRFWVTRIYVIERQLTFPLFPTWVQGQGTTMTIPDSFCY